ncbi:MAG: 2-oxo acid dehydrogenase subunit E2, partial [Luminiphilus sp.]|nr:2-oxo acid dehydrogenase subunit E2 [Luminiphilus sp.]
MSVTVTVPDIGGAEGAEVVEILVAVGDLVELEQSLIVLESDKASMEIPATVAGKVLELRVALGDALSEGDAVLVIEGAEGADEAGEAQASAAVDVSEGASAESAELPQAAEVNSATVDSESAVQVEPAATDNLPAVATTEVSEGTGRGADALAEMSDGDVYAGPAVRKLAREFGIDLAQVSGSGRRGRIVKEDLHSYSRQRLQGAPTTTAGSGLPTVPDIDFSQDGPVEVEARSRLDQVTAKNMTRSWLNVPHVTQFDGADITDLESFRASMKQEAERRGSKLTPMPFVLKACAVALAAHPKLKSS